MRYPVILFDLFRTVLLFTPMAPTGQVKEPTWRSAMGALRHPAAEVLPGVDFDAFLDALLAASEDIARDRPPEHFEIPVAERYRRALLRIGCDGSDASSIAERLSQAQMAALAVNTELPTTHRDLLEALARDRRVGIISNFDDSPTVHGLLARHGLDRLLSTAVISIDFGRRKPHPAIFREALRIVGATPADALFVGDSIEADVGGARDAGLDAAWLNVAGKDLPAGVAKPTYVLSQLADLQNIVGVGD